MNVEDLISKYYGDMTKLRKYLEYYQEPKELTGFQLRVWQLDREKAGSIRDMSYKLLLPRKYIEQQLDLILYKVHLDYLENEYEYDV